SEVKALSVPPFSATCCMISPLPKVGVPLNIICSTQCEMPVMPECSLRAPTRYHTQNETTGAECTSLVSRVSPLGKECLSKVAWRVVIGDFCFSRPFAVGDLALRFT